MKSTLQTSSIVAGIALCLFLHTPANAQCDLFPVGGHVGLFADAEGKSNVIVFDPTPAQRTIYLVAFLSGATADGFVDVQFRVEVEHPNGWFFNPSYPSASNVIGQTLDVEPMNPTNSAGVIVGWPQCVTGGAGGAGTPVVIGTISAFPLPASAQTTELRVKRFWPPTNPGAPCARFSLCDDIFSRAPMPAIDVDAFGEEIVSRAYLVLDTPIGVEPESWSRIKRLYE